MTETPAPAEPSFDQRRLASERGWSGFVTRENAEALADRIRRMTRNRLFTFVAVNEYFGYRPEVRTDQRMNEVKVWAPEDQSYGGVTLVDTYGVGGLHWSCPDQASARKASDDVRHAYVEIKRDQITITHRAPAGYRLFWTIALQEGGAELE